MVIMSSHKGAHNFDIVNPTHMDMFVHACAGQYDLVNNTCISVHSPDGKFQVNSSRSFARNCIWLIYRDMGERSILSLNITTWCRELQAS